MKASSFPFPNSLVLPRSPLPASTSELIELGPFISTRYPGMIHYPPIGNRVISSIRKYVAGSHESIDAMSVQIPGYMKRNLLDCGEKVEPTFEKKFVRLPPPMEDYMILTTPEMEILDWLQRENLSYRNLPIRLSFSKAIFRPISNPSKVRKLREVEVRAMISLDLDLKSYKESLRSYEDCCENIFTKLGICFEKHVASQARSSSHLGFDLEYFYKCDEGENVLNLPNGMKGKALSLSMGYRYNPTKDFIQVRGPNNGFIDPIVGTYAVGLERLLFASFDSCKDRKGFNLPESIRPFDISVLAFTDEEEVIRKATELYRSLCDSGKRIWLDDRPKIKRVEKARLSDFMGIPEKIVVSKGGVNTYSRSY